MARKSIIVNGQTVFVHQDQIFQFQTEIEKLVEQGELTYIEAIVHYCKLSEIDIETVKSLISPAMMLKITNEAHTNNLIKKDDSVKLPL